MILKIWLRPSPLKLTSPVIIKSVNRLKDASLPIFATCPSNWLPVLNVINLPKVPATLPIP